MSKEQSCTCKHCVSACEGQPGWFAPGEAELAASYLEVPFDEFVNDYLILDHASNPKVGMAPYVYAPRKRGVDSVNDKIRSHINQRRPGRCVFLINNRCEIHAVKPFECRKAVPCEGVAGFRDNIERYYLNAGAPLGMRPEPCDDYE